MAPGRQPCCAGKIFFRRRPEKPISPLRTSFVTLRPQPLIAPPWRFLRHPTPAAALRPAVAFPSSPFARRRPSPRRGVSFVTLRPQPPFVPPWRFLRHPLRPSPTCPRRPDLPPLRVQNHPILATGRGGDPNGFGTLGKVPSFFGEGPLVFWGRLVFARGTFPTKTPSQYP